MSEKLVVFWRLRPREWQNRISHEELLRIDGVDFPGDLAFGVFDGHHVYFCYVFDNHDHDHDHDHYHDHDHDHGHDHDHDYNQKHSKIQVSTIKNIKTQVSRQIGTFNLERVFAIIPILPLPKPDSAKEL